METWASRDCNESPWSTSARASRGRPTAFMMSGALADRADSRSIHALGSCIGFEAASQRHARCSASARMFQARARALRRQPRADILRIRGRDGRDPRADRDRADSLSPMPAHQCPVVRVSRSARRTGCGFGAASESAAVCTASARNSRSALHTRAAAQECDGARRRAAFFTWTASRATRSPSPRQPRLRETDVAAPHPVALPVSVGRPRHDIIADGANLSSTR